jgi:hypothetical protein
MSVSSDTVLKNAARILGDAANIHWPASTLLAWLNEAQHQIAVEIPAASKTVAAVTCVEGARQSLPTGSIMILGVDGLRAVDKGGMDSESPAWQSTTGSNTTTMWMRSPTNPREFYTYPPREATPGTLAGVEYSVVPAEVTLGDNIVIPDQYSEALTDYVVARALSEDSDLAEPGRAEHFMASFNARIGKK